MRQLLGFVVLTTLAAILVGCPLLKKGSDASIDEEDLAPADAATVTVSGTGAKNEGSITRYANETPLENAPGVIGKDGAKARNFPGNGPEVATLAKGTVVAKIASYFSTGVLVMFDDPSGDGTKLMGWVPPKAFDVSAPAPTKTVVVPKVVDAGAPKPPQPPQDAGTTPVVDAGGGGTVTVDAGKGGGGLEQPSKGAIAVSPIDGKCPDGWAVQADKMCRRKCTKDGDPICPRTTKCVAGTGGKICSTGN